MAKDRNGYVYEEKEKWIPRITTTDENGKRRNIKRTAKSKSEAKELLKQIFSQFDDEGVKAQKLKLKARENQLAGFYF